LKTINLAGRWKKQESRTTGYPTPPSPDSMSADT
jgi:hypothetical protein